MSLASFLLHTYNIHTGNWGRQVVSPPRGTIPQLPYSRDYSVLERFKLIGNVSHPRGTTPQLPSSR
jgi:hypothetical protein